MSGSVINFIEKSVFLKNIQAAVISSNVREKLKEKENTTTCDYNNTTVCDVLKPVIEKRRTERVDAMMFTL